MNTKTLFRWHLWLGLVTGAILFVVGGSGAVAAFIEEIDWLVTPALRANRPAGAAPASADAMLASVRAAYPGDRVTALNLSGRPAFAHVAKVQSKARGNLDVFIDPASGRIKGDRVTTAAYTSTLRNFIRQLHLRLLMGLWGRVFVGVFGVTLVVSSVTGLWIYRGWIKNVFRLRWQKGGRTRWSDLHKLVGLWSLLFNLLVGLTGAVYGYENLAGQIRSHWLRAREERPAATAKAAAARPPAARVRPADASLGVDALLQRAREEFPDLAVRNVLLPANPTAPVVLRGDVPSALVMQSHVRRASFISFDPVSGQVRQRVDGRDATGWDRAYSAFDPLHFGYFGGMPTKVLWFFLGLAPSALAFTGAWLWWRRMRPGREGPNEAAVLAGASNVRGIVIAAVAVTLLGAYALVARAQGNWSLTPRLLEHALAKPLALALTAFPVTLALLWLARRSVANRIRLVATSGLCAAWYLTLVTLFQ